MKKRWMVYILIGFLFGIFDFYYQEFTESLITSTSMWFLVAWSVWLVPAIPIVLYETKRSQDIIKSIFANILVWCVSVISYYMYIPFKLVFIGQPSMKYFYISNYKNKFYLSNLKSLTFSLISRDIPEWLVIAVLGGLVVGFCVSFSYLYAKKLKSKKK